MKKYLKCAYLFLLWFICMIYNVQYAQMLQLNIYDNTEKKIVVQKNFSSQTELDKHTRHFLYEYYLNGYLLADFDSIVQKNNIYTYYFQKGLQFKWVKLTKGNLENKLYYEYFQEKNFYRQPVRYLQVVQLFEKIIKHYENNGYPFASIQLDSIHIDSNMISAALKINKNRVVYIDSVIVQGNLKINKKFLYKYIDVKPSALYNEKKLKQIEPKLKKLPFIHIRQSPIVRITDRYNKVYIFADNKNASQFDGIVGFQPDANGKTIITGNIKIKLFHVVFKNAEQIDVEWQRVQALTQNFKFYFSMPYVLGTPLGGQYQITIFKKDTSFIDVQNQIGIGYYYSGINHLNFFFKQRNSNLISTYGLSGITILPDYADVTTKYYGSGIYFNNLNNVQNPSNGWQVQLQIAVGNKDIRKNPKINEAAYQNVLLHSLQYQSEGVIEKYFPKFLSKYSALKLAVKYGYIGGTSTLFKNELFRIGGLKTLRGFNEQSIFADTYMIPTLEYRFVYNENGYLMLFSDFAYYTTNYGQQKQANQVYTFGAGIQFDTKAGLFNLIYAIGTNIGQSPDIRTGKIHAGIMSVF